MFLQCSRESFRCLLFVLLLPKQDGELQLTAQGGGNESPEILPQVLSAPASCFPIHPRGEKRLLPSCGCPFRAPESAYPQVSALLTASMSLGTCCWMEAGPLQLQIPYKEWSRVSRHVLSLLEVSQAPSWVQALKSPECLHWPVRDAGSVASQ